ncbi:MAG TPA: hypothetical protein PLV93_11390, partial [Microthrixaceae bacterium]|nr:hypothetical protein [Microthrixaceae bacterium]
MAKSDGRVPSANEMVEAFIHPPTVLSIGVRRVEGSTVVVLASVELWPWRTVLRAVLADSAFEPSRVDFPTEPTASTVPGAVPGRVTAESQPARRRESLEWMMAFS